MRAKEMLVLDAINIAGVVERRMDQFWTDARGILRVIQTDDRMQVEWGPLAKGWTYRGVVSTLRALRTGWPRSEPLVDYYPRPGRAGYWCMSRKGLQAMCA